MPDLFSIAEILAATGGTAHNLSATSVQAVSIDSRSVAGGALFVAIRGARLDGHEFVADAISNGAAAALVSADRVEEFAGLPLIVVPDVLEGLNDLARAARARSRARIVAVTGSVGKTTTKEALALTLSAFGRTHASIKSYNNLWGVPLMLASLPADAAFGVFEIGMNHAGEITPLAELVRPDVAVITAIAPAHIGNLGSLGAIADAKSEIFSGLAPGGPAIINADHDQLDRLREAARKAGAQPVSYGYAETADVRLTDYRSDERGARARLELARQVDLALTVPGRHMMANAAAAVLVADAFGLDPQKAARAVGAMAPAEGRGRVEEMGPSDNPLILVDEAYNANPSSMRAALEVFGLRSVAGQKVLVLGDMRELGVDAPAMHAGLADAVAALEPDAVYLVGDDMNALAEALAGRVRVAAASPDAAGIEDALLNGLDYGDAVMLKGSLSVGLGQLVSGIRRRFGTTA